MWRLAILWTLFFTSAAIAAEQEASASTPARVGNRTAVIEFSAIGGAKPTALTTVSTESIALSDLAKSLLRTGKLDLNSPGISKLSDDRYRLTVSLPIPNDGDPLPPDTTPPVARIRQCPVYPFKLVEANVTGGAVIRLSIDEKAHLQKVELVSASHPEFGPVAVQAVGKWVYAKPAMKSGKPVSVSMLQLITFEFDGGKQAPLLWQIAPEPHLPEFIVMTSPQDKPATVGETGSK